MPGVFCVPGGQEKLGTVPAPGEPQQRRVEAWSRVERGAARPHSHRAAAAAHHLITLQIVVAALSLVSRC